MENIFTPKFISELSEMTERNAHGEALHTLAKHISESLPDGLEKTIYEGIAQDIEEINREHYKTGYLTESLYITRRNIMATLLGCIQYDFGADARTLINSCL